MFPASGVAPPGSADTKSQTRPMPPPALMSETAVMTTADEQPATDAQARYADAQIRRITAENGIEYAYHDLGPAGMRCHLLVLPLQHFRRESRRHWDPALIGATSSATAASSPSTTAALAATGIRPGPNRPIEAVDFRRDRIRRSDGPQEGGSTRVLDRQLRRAGDCAYSPRPAPARRARVLGSAGRRRDARVGT